MCLRKGHIVADCDVKTNCKICQKKHHELLHLQKKPRTKTIEKSKANVNHTYVKRYIDDVTDESDSDDHTSEQQESEEQQEIQD